MTTPNPTREILQWSFATSLAGGMRKTILTDRPWQQPMRIDQGACPFEILTDDPKMVKCTFTDAEGWGWRLRINTSTPYRYHRLIIPPNCMSTEELWRLGGASKIAAALATASKAVSIESREIQSSWLFMYVHVGYTAGQRYGHLHWHLNVPELPGALSTCVYGLASKNFVKEHNLIIWEDDILFVAAGGVRAGQCLIIPKRDTLDIDAPPEQGHLAQTLERLILLCNDKFRSTQGHSPDYEVCLVLKNGLCQWATYIPILNFMGGSEYLAMMTNSAYCIPWPHEVTAMHLRG